MKRIISLLLLICPVLVSATLGNDKAAVQAVIARHYSRPLAAHKCQLTEPPEDGQIPPNSIVYCMKPVADHTVTHSGKTAHYVPYTGSAYSTKQKIKQDVHASPDLVELFILEKTDDKWAIKQYGRDEIGTWGDVPEDRTWKFVQVGAQNWDYTVESSYTGQDDTTTSQNFLFTDDNNHIRKSFIISGNDYSLYASPSP